MLIWCCFLLFLASSYSLVWDNDANPNCPANGVFDCAANSITTTVTYTNSTTVRNCIFKNCPSLTVTGNAQVVFSNCTFLNYLAGPAEYYLIGTNSMSASVTIQNCTFDTGVGVAVMSNQASTLVVSNSIFSNIVLDSYTYGQYYGDLGAVYAYQSSLILNNCAFYNITNTGWGASVSAAGSSVNVNGVKCQLVNAAIGSCVLLDYLSYGNVSSVWLTNANTFTGAIFTYAPADTISFRNLNLTHSVAAYGTFMAFMNGVTQNVTVYVYDSIFSSGRAANSGGMIYLDTYGDPARLKVQFNNCSFSDAYSNDGGMLYAGNNAIVDLTMINCRFYNITAGTADSNPDYNRRGGLGAAFSTMSQMTVNLQTCSFCRINSISTKGSGTIFAVGGTYDISNSTFDSGFGPNGGAMVFSGTSVQMAGVNVKNYITNGNGGKYTNVCLGFSGAIQLKTTAQMYFSSPQSVFEHNRAAYGGSIYIQDAALGSFANISFTNNNASILGGAIYIDSTSTSTMATASIQTLNNYAGTNNYTSFIALMSSTASGYINFIETGNINTLQSIYIDNVNLASYYSSIESQDPNLKGALFGSPTSLQISGIGANATLALDFSNQIPDFTFKVLDSFGQIVTPLSYIVCQIDEILNNATIYGERYSLVSGVGTYEDLTLAAGVSPGKRFRFQVMGLSGLYYNPSNIWPTFDIVYSNCPTGTIQNDDVFQCLPIKNTLSVYRYVMACLAIAGLLVSLACVYGIYVFREFSIIKSNSYTFLQLTLLGIIMSMVSVLSQIYYYSSMCIISEFLLNVGFYIIFFSFTMKMYRIKMIFKTKQAKMLKTQLQDSSLLTWFGVMVTTPIIFMIIWGVVASPNAVTTLVLDQYYTTERCQNSIFSSLAPIFRFVVALAVAALAFIIRDVPSDFNETSAVGFAAYNFVIFGTLISLLAEFSVTDVNTSFIANAFAVLFPCYLALGSLIAVKIYKCYMDPLSVKNRLTTIRGGGKSVVGDDVSAR